MKRGWVEMNKTADDIVKNFEVVLENLNDYKELYEMANYRKDESKLAYNLWFDEEGENRENIHVIPRVKIEVEGRQLIPVSVSEQPEILLKGNKLKAAEMLLKGSGRKQIFDFISRNYKLILSHWNGVIGTKTLLNGLE
jgi:hypothetical protein